MWRKSWVEMNIRGKDGNGVCSKRKLLPEERSVWDDYLDMATPPIAPIPGQICISAEIGYTPEQLAVVLKTPVDVIRKANTAMEGQDMITVENNGIVVINNWKRYQSDYERQKSYRGELHNKVTSRGNTSKGFTVDKRRKDIDKKYKRKEYESIYKKVFDHWNAADIIKHKYLTDLFYGDINTRLDYGYTLEEICQAITNYAYILNGRQFFWSHRWTLQEFVRRGLDKFMDLGKAKLAYADKYRQKEEFESEYSKTVKELSKR